MQRKTIIIAIVVLLAILSIGAIGFFYFTPKANIRVITSPQNSIIKIGDQQIERAKPTYIKKGVYELSVEAPNFTSVKKQVTIGDELETYSFCLTPTNTTLEKYLEEHPDDKLTCEAAGGQEYKDMTRQALEAYPILEKLPYEDGTFIIGQARGENNEIVLTVHYSTETSKREALEWLNKATGNKPLPTLTYTQDYVQTTRISVGGPLDTALRQKYPIIDNLPLDLYIYKIGYRIDQSDPSGRSIKLTIDSDTTAGRLGAIRHIRTLGYNPTDYKIEFINYQEGGLK